jgi:hypothetical protein
MNNEDFERVKLEMIANTNDLAAAIKRLERKRSVMEEDMKDDMHAILESLKPANILRTTLHEVQESTPLKHNLLKIAVGLGAGYFSKQLIVGKSAGLVKKALGTALQFGITQFIAKKDDSGNSQDLSHNSHGKKSLLKRIFSI